MVEEVVDAVLAEVVGADVGDDGGFAAVDGEAAAEDAAASDLEDGEVDLGVAQDGARGAGAGPVAGLDQALVDGHAVGRGVAGDQAGGAGDAGEQAGGGGLAVGAGDQGDGDAAEPGPRDVGGLG
jgi:streptogrisin D